MNKVEETRLKNLFAKQREIQFTQWMDSKLPCTSIPMEPYWSRSADPNTYFYANSAEITNHSYSGESPDQLLLDIDPRTRRYHLDNVFRAMIDYCNANGVQDPVIGGALVHRGMREAFYRLAHRFS